MTRQELDVVKIVRPNPRIKRAGSPLLKQGALALVALLSVGCGSDDKKEHIGEERDPLECKVPINTGYPGDRNCLEPPEPGKGFQVRYGPSNYDDVEEVQKYLIAGHDETTDCIFLKTPNDHEVFMGEYHARMRPSSHHMITYTQNEEHADSTAPEECDQGPSSRFLVGSQEEKIDIQSHAGAPELVGAAMRLGPRLQAAIQLHYVNTGDEPMLKEAWINAIYMDPKDVKLRVEPIFWLGGLLTTIEAHTQKTVKARCVVGEQMRSPDGPIPTPSDLKLLQVTGHYHAHTTKFTGWKVDGQTGERIRIYQSYSYKDPGFTYFNSVADNPSPESSSYGGDYDGELFMKIGDSVEWECEVNNTSDIDLKFGNKVYEAEMCNMFGVYAPSSGLPWACFNL